MRGDPAAWARTPQFQVDYRVATRRPTWRRKPSRKPVAEYVVWSDLQRNNRSYLLSTWIDGWHKDDAARVPLLSAERCIVHPLAERLGQRCTACRSIRHDRIPGPIDVTILSHTYGGDRLTAGKLRNVRVTLPIGSVPAIMRLETLDLLRPFTDDAWMVGDVYLQTGERLGGFRSVVDRLAIPHRRRYRPDWFKYRGSASFRRCKRCGGFDHRLTMGGTYLLASEIPGPAVRLELGSLLVERSIAAKLDMSNRGIWPGGSTYTIPVYDERLDPIPTPYPMSWDDLVRQVALNDDFPFDELGSFTKTLRVAVRAAKSATPTLG